MALEFRLGNLLRLRRLQEQEAAQKLAAREQRLRAQRARSDGIKAELTEDGPEVGVEIALRATAAATAAGASMLTMLRAAEAEELAGVQAAERRFAEARTQTAGLEKLEERHLRLVAEQEQAADQLALDEIASQAWHRTEGAAR